MNKSMLVFRLLLGAAALFCLFFGLIPPLIYGIVNSGVAVLLLSGGVLGAFAFFLPRMGHRPRLILLILLGMGLLAAGALSTRMARQAYHMPPPQEGEITVIVLGGKVNGDRPSLMLARRLYAAAAYLDRNPQATCVVSGGQGPDEEYPEALVMASYLEELGIDPRRIRQEDRSTNTWENISFSMELLEDGSQRVAIATDGFHQLRASVYAKKAGVEECFSLSAKTPWGLLPAYWVREWMGLPVAWMSVR